MNNTTINNQDGMRSQPGLGNDATWWVLVVLGAVSLASLAAEFIPQIDKNPSELGLVIGALLVGLVILIFLVSLFDRTKVRKEPGQKMMWLYAFVLGGLIGPWVALKGNEAMQEGLEGFVERNALADWWPALSAPAVEELAKGAVVFGIIVVFRYLVTRPIHALYVGVAVGFGFQITEDVLYAMSAALDSLNSDFAGGIQSAILRTATGLISHWIYSGFVAVGIAYLMGITYKPTPRTKRIGVGAALIVAAIGLHFLWNSPLSFEDSAVVGLLLIAKVIVVFVAFVVLVRVLVKQDREALGLPRRKERRAQKKAEKLAKKQASEQAEQTVDQTA